MTLETSDQARQLIRASGSRLTSARVRVLAELMSADSALTHLELQKRVEAGADPIDRVTLYRVLDWLDEVKLAHRVAGPDRVFRFSAQASRTPHGHFRCVQCTRMYCLKESGALLRGIKAMLPSGFAGDEFELTVSGRCARCAAVAGTELAEAAAEPPMGPPSSVPALPAPPPAPAAPALG
ncbi:MAG: Fur family transcriptional regulator [Burkholderiaceae bacterium]